LRQSGSPNLVFWHERHGCLKKTGGSNDLDIGGCRFCRRRGGKSIINRIRPDDMSEESGLPRASGTEKKDLAVPTLPVRKWDQFVPPNLRIQNAGLNSIKEGRYNDRLEPCAPLQRDGRRSTIVHRPRVRLIVQQADPPRHHQLFPIPAGP
jgi:hypothetical protein